MTMKIATASGSLLGRNLPRHVRDLILKSSLVSSEFSFYPYACCTSAVSSSYHAPLGRVRQLAVAASKKPASDGSSLSYLALKKAAKVKRRELFAASEERKQRLTTRRVGKPRDEMRREFRSWFIPHKVNEEYMERKARQAGLDWKIQVSVMLTRGNVVLPDKEDWEVEYENLDAYLSRFGKIYPKELFDVDYDADVATTDEKLVELLPKGFTPAPRETDADASGDVRTTNRKLKTDVYLAVQEKGDGLWQLPTIELSDDETLLEAAKRAISEKIGSQVEYWSISNAPLSVFMKPYPAEQQTNGFYGTKTFFMKLYYDEGLVSEEEMTVKDFAWLDRGEVTARIRDQDGELSAKFYHYLL